MQAADQRQGNINIRDDVATTDSVLQELSEAERLVCIACPVLFSSLVGVLLSCLFSSLIGVLN